ncbi:mechanosensitive ion channel [Persicimonas caeni]|uniref:Mechanosensitive ion channel n=1 Tax=Persicimonas caeni TaxID=2292766 RepID=A0A4Y6Q2D5_PERCE|nr:mechanosensitive ion channel domain-containing protein [Persicimonas caeni]QDG54726.1 mechanosensitive ion channel [Persicimonas caeni]QED35947.1 mechanosensitive ion channel [Persicimonas caeni]
MLHLLHHIPLVAQADAETVAELAQKADLFEFEKIIWALAIIGAAVVASRVLQATLEKMGEGNAKRRLMLKKVASFSRVAIFAIALYMLVMTFFDAEEDKTALLGLGGTLAVTIGFALKDTASSVMAGILILVDQPFQVGDRVTFGDTYGEVTEIGLRSVRIQTLDDSEVSIPNNKFLTEAVTSGNSGALDMMIVIKFYISMDEDFDLARRIIYEACVTSKYVYLNKPVTITMKDDVTGMAFSTIIQCKAYVIDVRYEKAFETDVTARVKRAFREHGIEYPRVGISTAAA